ncbi:MAG TPA: hypothetical protein VEI25_18395, partial [Paraburkholderia sp.]|nr:hypothetical protein [Paraburkholderia sp.]
QCKPRVDAALFDSCQVHLRICVVYRVFWINVVLIEGREITFCFPVACGRHDDAAKPHVMKRRSPHDVNHYTQDWLSAGKPAG